MAKKEQNHIDPEKIHLLRIEPLEISISDLKKSFSLEESIDMKIAHISAHNIDENGFLMRLDVKLTLEDRKPKQTASFRYNFHFIVDNLKQMYSLQKNGEPVFSNLFASTLAGISYSTLRGVIFEKLLNSSWGAITIPVINPANILASWIDVK